MAGTNERVMDMVRKEIDKNPDIKSQELYDKAKKLDSSLGSLSVRQFHASYPLQVKRARKAGKRRAAKPASARKRARGGRAPAKAARRAARAGRTGSRRAARSEAGGAGRKTRRGGGAARATPVAPAAAPAGREVVRSILIQFAGEVAAAEGKADVVHVIGDMDRYVDRLLQAAAR